MKVLVFGATGGTGSHVAQQALAKGYTVTAFTRHPDKIKISHPNLIIAQGNVLEQQSIDRILPGHDAVICCLGMPAGKAGTLRSEGTKKILIAMQKAGISRFICQTSLGYGDSVAVLSQTPFIFRKIIVPFLLKSTFADHRLQEEYIQQSSSDYTIVRPGSLTNGGLTGKYRYGFSYDDKKIKVKISRADTANFLVQQLSSAEFLKKVAGISY